MSCLTKLYLEKIGHVTNGHVKVGAILESPTNGHVTSLISINKWCELEATYGLLNFSV